MNRSVLNKKLNTVDYSVRLIRHKLPVREDRISQPLNASQDSGKAKHINLNGEIIVDITLVNIHCLFSGPFGCSGFRASDCYIPRAHWTKSGCWVMLWSPWRWLTLKYVASHYVTLKLDLWLQELCSVPKLVGLDHLDEFWHSSLVNVGQQPFIYTRIQLSTVSKCTQWKPVGYLYSLNPKS